MAVAAGLLSLGCGHTEAKDLLAHQTENHVVSQTAWNRGAPSCRIASQSAPWVVDWPPAARGRLEQGLSLGGIVAKVHGCDVELMPHCGVAGDGYRYLPFTEKEESLFVDDVDTLFAKLPLGAPRLLAEIERSGGLEVRTTMVGRYALSVGDRRAPVLRGRCEGATHVIAAATVGAFRMETAQSATISTGLSEAVGSRDVAARRTLARDGDPRRCRGASPEDDRPPRGCAAVLRVELDPLAVSVDRIENGLSCPSGASMIPGGNRQGEPFEAYCVDRFETTVEAYAACVGAGECTPASTRASWDDISAAARELSGELCNAANPDRGDHPINCVGLDAADAYCSWRGGAVPSDAAWSWAATMGVRQRYPWGDATASAEHANACGRECKRWFGEQGAPRRRVLYGGDDGHAGTSPVGSYPRGQSAAGLSDLAGNVAEWVHAPDGGDSTRVRGGSFLVQVASWLELADITVVSASREDPGIGFRCVYPPRSPVADGRSSYPD